MEKECVNRKEIEKDCPCPKTACANHGFCCACIANHRKSGKPTSCMAALVK